MQLSSQVNGQSYIFRFVLYIGIAGAAMNPQIIGIDMDLIQLSVFRISLIFLTAALLLRDLSYKPRLKNILASNAMPNRLYRNIKYTKAFMLIWLLYATTSLLWAKDQLLWAKNVFYLCVANACMYVIPRVVIQPKQIQCCLRSFVIMGLIHNIVGWYEVITGDYRFLTTTTKAWVYTYTQAPASLFGGENILATFLVFSTIFTIICLVESENKLGKLICMSLVISSVLLLFRTTSRGNIFGLAAAAIVYTYYALLRGKKHTKHIIALFIAIYVMLYLVFNTSILSTILEKLQIDFSSTQNSSDVIRLNLIKSGLKYLVDSYLIGVGAGSSSFMLQHNAVYDTGNIVVMHNYWLEILTDYGVIIFTSLVVFIVRTFCSIRYIYRHTNNSMLKTIALGFMCCLVAFIPCSISGSSYLGYDWLWVFWGLVLAIQRSACFIDETGGQ